MLKNIFKQMLYITQKVDLLKTFSERPLLFFNRQIRSKEKRRNDQKKILLPR